MRGGRLMMRMSIITRTQTVIADFEAMRWWPILDEALKGNAGPTAILVWQSDGGPHPLQI